MAPHEIRWITDIEYFEGVPIVGGFARNGGRHSQPSPGRIKRQSRNPVFESDLVLEFTVSRCVQLDIPMVAIIFRAGIATADRQQVSSGGKLNRVDCPSPGPETRA
jgi:hypothetical protein